MDFLDYNDSKFKEDNFKTMLFAKLIKKYFKYLEGIFTVAFINCHSLYLKRSGFNFLCNNNLLLLPKGSAKTTFLRILAVNNPKVVVVLPNKMFESELAKKNRSWFNDKIFVHYDLIGAFQGMSKKQKEQLVNFWTNLLADGYYHRDVNEAIGDVRCVTMFGLALDMFTKYKGDLFESTFLDRLVVITQRFSTKEEKEILEFRWDNKEIEKDKLFKIKSGRKVSIRLDTKKFGDKIVEFALDLRKFDVLSSTRAQDYVTDFLKSNAYFNDRKIVNESDLKLYGLLHHYHIDKQDVSKLNRLIHLIDENPSLSHTKLMEKLGWSRGTFYKYFKQYKFGKDG